MNRVMMLECVEETDGFKIGKSYKCLGNAGLYVEMVDDNNERVILFGSHFKGFTKRNK